MLTVSAAGSSMSSARAAFCEMAAAAAAPAKGASAKAVGRRERGVCKWSGQKHLYDD